ncbi:MAG: hypothetical protein C4289_03585 [Chloroflexota bacterium]
MIRPVVLTRRHLVSLTATTGAASCIAALASACRPAGTRQSEPAIAVGPSAVRKGTQITLHVRTGTEADTLEERIPLLEQQLGIKVHMETFPGGEYYQKIQTLITGGSLGDVLWGASATGTGHLWAYSGVIRFLDDLIRAEKFDLNQYYSSAVDGVKFEGKVYGLPYKLQPGPMGIYYNIDAFEQSGATPPDLNSTFDQLIELAKRTQRQDGDTVTRWGFFPTGRNPGYQWVVHYVRAWGGDVISDDGRRSQLSSPQAMAALEWYWNVVTGHRVAPTGKNMQNADFVKGQVAMLQSGSWSKSLPTQVRDAFRIGNTLMPRGPSGRRGSMAVTDFIAINARTKNVPESWELTKFLTDKETGIRLGEGRGGASGTSGGRPDVFHSERLLANPLHKVWIEAAETAMNLKLPWNFLGEEHQSVLNARMNPIIDGDQAPTRAYLQEVDRELQAVLDKPRP